MNLSNSTILQEQNISLPAINFDKISHLANQLKTIENSLKTLKQHRKKFSFSPIQIDFPHQKFAEITIPMEKISQQLDSLEAKIREIDRIKKQQNQNFLRQMIKYEQQKVIYKKNESQELAFLKCQLDEFTKKNQLQEIRDRK